MSLETAQYLHQLNASNPSGADYVKEGDDHIRMLKAVLKATFPGIQGPIDAAVTHTFLNGLASSVVPKGAIILWTGTEASVPSGWAIADGRTVTGSDGSSQIVTANLSGRAPVGVSPSVALGAQIGQTSRTITTGSGGEHSHSGSTSAAGQHSHGGGTGGTSLTVDQMPAHRHRVVRSLQGSGILSDQGFIAEGKTDGGNDQYRLVNSFEEPDRALTGISGSGSAHGHSIGADGNHTHSLSVDGVGGHSHSATIDVTQPSLGIYFIQKI